MVTKTPLVSRAVDKGVTSIRYLSFTTFCTSLPPACPPPPPPTPPPSPHPPPPAIPLPPLPRPLLPYHPPPKQFAGVIDSMGEDVKAPASQSSHRNPAANQVWDVSRPCSHSPQFNAHEREDRSVLPLTQINVTLPHEMSRNAPSLLLQ